MSRLLNLLLLPPVMSALQARYRQYRSHHASRSAAAVMVFCVAAGWLFLRFESPSWQRVIAQRTRWYPQISAEHPKFADPLRYVLQSLWLLVILPSNGVRERFTYVRWPQQLRDKIYGWLETLPVQVEQNPLEARVIRRVSTLNRAAKRVLMLLAGIVALVLAMFCISQPFGYTAQFVFVVPATDRRLVLQRQKTQHVADAASLLLAGSL